MKNTYLIRYRVETDDKIRGEYGTLARARELAKPEEYILSVCYREAHVEILKFPEVKLFPEIKKSDWLVLTGEEVKRFCIDVDSLDLSDAEKKDPLQHMASIFARYSDYVPFRDAEEVTVASILRKKFGVRITGTIDTTTEWQLFNSYKEGVAFLQKEYNVKVEKVESSP